MDISLSLSLVLAISLNTIWSTSFLAELYLNIPLRDESLSLSAMIIGIGIDEKIALCLNNDAPRKHLPRLETSRARTTLENINRSRKLLKLVQNQYRTIKVYNSNVIREEISFSHLSVSKSAS
jgi:hypothetical protein